MSFDSSIHNKEEVAQYLATFVRTQALQLSLRPDDYEAFEDTIMRFINDLSKAYERMMNGYSGEAMQDIRPQFRSSLDTIRESLAEMVADWRDGATYEDLVTELERHKMIWFNELPLRYIITVE